MLSRSPPKPAKFTRQRTDGYRSAPVSSSYAQTSRSIAMTPKQVDWPQAHSDPQIARRGTAVTDCGRGPLAYAPPASGSEFAPSRALMGCATKRAPETKPSTLRQGQGSRRSRSADKTRPVRATRIVKASVSAGARAGPQSFGYFRPRQWRAAEQTSLLVSETGRPRVGNQLPVHGSSGHRAGAPLTTRRSHTRSDLEPEVGSCSVGANRRRRAFSLGVRSAHLFA